MTVKLYVRNDGTEYVGLNKPGGELKDTILIKPGDATEVILVDTEDDPITEVSTLVLDADAVAEIHLAKYPPPEPVDEGEPEAPVDVTVNVLSFSADASSTLTVSLEDAAKVDIGDMLTLTQTGGVADALAADSTAIVTDKVGEQLTTDLDLTGVDVTDLTATAVVTLA